MTIVCHDNPERAFIKTWSGIVIRYVPRDVTRGNVEENEVGDEPKLENAVFWERIVSFEWRVSPTSTDATIFSWI